MTAENAQALLKQLQQDHGGDFSNLGHSEDNSNLPEWDDAKNNVMPRCFNSDAGRMGAVGYALRLIGGQFPENDFVKSILLGGACDQTGYMIQSKNERIDQVVAEIRQLREMNNNTEIDLVQMDRKLEWLNTLVAQRTEMELLHQHCKDAYKAVIGKDYVKRSKSESPVAAKARRDANMTLLSVDAILAAADKKSLTTDAFSEEAAFAVHNSKQEAIKATKKTKAA